jgi:crotonobetainyl-CoA:carnitine CoA-transferase CaiB-like acyl-CoA transferase
VESVNRLETPPTALAGFYAALHAGKQRVLLDFRSESGRAALRALICNADIILESSRPRALLQLGIDAAALVREKPGMIWARITAHGTGHETRVGFGDDTAAAGGLVERNAAGAPCFIGDAIADPLAGIAAARAILAARDEGGGVLLDIAMSGVAAEIAG